MFSNKKKIRGWKRHIRKIEKWKRRVMDLDMEHLHTYHRDYAKLWIHPFYALPRRNPPAWYNALLLEAMVEVYAHWNKTLLATGEPYYLKLWIFDPHFIHSQIVAAYQDCLHFYDQTFDAQKIEKPFPFHKYPKIQDKLQLFDWHLYVDCDTYAESDLTDHLQRGWMSEKEAASIRQKAYKTTVIQLPNGETDTGYSVRAGDVWVGSLKSEDKPE
jgi:hypothetical protein